MSIYFVHFFGAFFSYALLSALFFYNLKNSLVFKLAFVGFVFSYFAFFISAKTLSYDLLYFSNDILFVLLFLGVIIFSFIKNNFLKEKNSSNIAFFIIFCFWYKIFTYFY